jgi:hypothetical protein
MLQDATINARFTVARGSSEIVDLTTETHAVAAQSCGSQKKAKASQLASGSDSAVILGESYWDSPKAKMLFLGSSTDNRSVFDVLQQRIERLQQLNRSPNGWRDLIDMHDVDILCSPYDIFIIQQCSVLCLAYIMALEEMNTARWVQDCCAQAVYDSNRMGIEAATSKLIGAGWIILLQAKREHFPLPDPKIHKQKKPLPDLLEFFREEITLPWIDYCIGSLADLTVESAQNKLITKIIPNYCLQVIDDDTAENETNGSCESTITIRDCPLLQA